MITSTPKHSFRPAQRLLNKHQFNDVFAQAQIRAAVPEVLVLASERLSTETSQGPRIGFIVPKKKIRRAVGRNHFKRIFRERFRHLSHDFPSLDLVVLARSGSQALNSKALHQIAEKLFDKIQRKFCDRKTSN
jgi:ribonuclease P protein component